MYDVTLVELWCEPIPILQSYHMMRQEIRECWRELTKKRLQPFLREKRATSRYWDVTRHSTTFPVSHALLSIAAALEQDSTSVQYVSLASRQAYATKDSDWRTDGIDFICATTNQIVGVTFTTREYEKLVEFLRSVKRRRPDLKTVVGGPHATFLDEEVAALECVDAVVRREGEETCRELVKRWLNGEPIADTKGVTYQQDGRVVRNPDRPLLEGHRIVMPAYHLLDEPTREGGHITTNFSRGCDRRCAYCAESAFWKGPVRYKDPARFCDELEIIASEFEQRFIHIADSTFGLDPTVTAALCSELERRKIDALFSVNVRSDVFQYLGREMLERMLNVGFVELFLGMETAEDDLMVKWRRRQSFAGFEDTLQGLRDIGFPLVSVYTFFGGPDDTAESIHKTIRAVDRLQRDGLIFYATGKFFMPTPGTAVFEHYAKDGYRFVSDRYCDQDRLCFPLPYVHKNLSSFELLHYLALLQSVQLANYMAELGGEETFLARFRDRAKELFLDEYYL